MAKKIEFEGVIDVAIAEEQLIDGELYVHISKKEADKVMWCHHGTKVKITMEPVKKDNSLFLWFVKKFEEWAKILKEMLTKGF